MNQGNGTPLSRRGFLRGTVTGAAAAAAGVGEAARADENHFPQAEQPPAEFDFTKGSAALQSQQVIDSACQFCNSNCRLKVHVKAGRVIDIVGEASDPVQAGGICEKGPMMAEILYSPLRLESPMKRVGGEKGSPDSTFEPCSWDEALGIIAKKFLTLRDAGEAHAIASKTSGRLPRGTGSLIGRLFTLLGSPNDTDVGPVCNDAGGNALAVTLGLGNFTNGYGLDGATGKEDLGSARFLLFLGTNQAETHPITFAYLLRERAKTKAKLVVIDPRLTPTGAQADLWLAPKPHTDLALVLGMLQHVIARKLYDDAYVRRWVIGFDELRQHLEKNAYTPDWAAGVTGIPADVIRSVAEGYASAKPAAIFCNAGISHQLGAFDTYRAIAFLAAITGNIGVNGGGCNFMHNTWPGGLNLPPIAAPTPARREALPVGPDWFAESVLNARPYALKAVITCGNPILASANSNKVRDAFKRLDFYAYTGLFMEEPAYYADVILPACSGLEFDGVYMRRDDRAIRWQHQAAPRVGLAKPDWEIWIDLAHALGKADTRNSPEYWTAHFPTEWRNYATLWETFRTHTPGMGGMTQARMEKRSEPLRWPCPTESHPGVSTLYLDHPSWYQAAEALDPKNQGKRFLTPSGRIEIHTPAIEQSLAAAGHAALPTFYTHPEVTGRNPTIAYKPDLVRNPINPQALTPLVTLGGDSDGAVHRDFPLMGMSGRPSVVHFAGVTHWTDHGKRRNGVRLVQIHPEAAAAAGVKDGDDILVESPRGSIRATALLWDGIRKDTIFVPNGFGPMQRVARQVGTPLYEPMNTLVDDRYFDNLSGQQAYKCFACRVRKA